MFRSRLILAACWMVLLVVARPARAADATWTELLPPARSQHSAIYDPIRDRMIVFGGLEGGDYRGGEPRAEVWALNLGGSPAWQLLVPAGQGPSPRYRACAVYDPVRDAMIIYGGIAAAFDNDVWELSLSGSPAWHQLTPTGTPPTPRYKPSAIYDPLRDRLLVFGGLDGSAHNDVWELTLGAAPAWREIVTEGTPPSPRWGHAAIYDAVRDRMIIFGYPGAPEDEDMIPDLWALSLAGTPTWSEIVPPGGIPSNVMTGYAAAYDASADRLVVDGGEFSYQPYSYPYSSGWSVALSGTEAWQSAAGGHRSNHSLIYDPLRSRKLAFGGNDMFGGGAMASAIAASGNGSWTQVFPPGPEPPLSTGQTAVFDPTPGRIVVFGGRTPTVSLDQPPDANTWFCAAGTNLWEEPQLDVLEFVQEHDAIYDEARDRMVVFGGQVDYFPVFSNATLALDLSDSPVWSEIPALDPPTPRKNAMALMDPVRDRMLIFGGNLVSCCFTYIFSIASLDTVWSLPFSGSPAWVPILPTGPVPPAREGALAVYDPVGDRCILFGGTTDFFATPFVDLWQLTLSGAPAWSPLEAAGDPPPPGIYAGVYDPARRIVLVCGGEASAKVWMLSLNGFPKWRELTTEGEPPGVLSEHVVVLDRAGDRLLMAGGSGTRGVWEMKLNPLLLSVSPLPSAKPSFALAPARNPERAIELVLTLPASCIASVDVYDLAGRLSLHEDLGLRAAGAQRIALDNSAALAPGLYLARVRAGGQSATARVVHLR